MAISPLPLSLKFHSSIYNLAVVKKLMNPLAQEGVAIVRSEDINTVCVHLLSLDHRIKADFLEVMNQCLLESL
jgi:hypothetical protein